MKKRTILLFTRLFLILIAISGCRGRNSTAGNDYQDVVPTPQAIEQNDVNSDWIKTGENAKWPDYLPKDIPELKGQIRKIMEGDGIVSIRYENLKKADLLDYLELLEKEGFNLEYRVYENPAYPESANERMKKGDYDDVVITKGDYRMTIGYGEGNITYDIDTWSFQEAIPTAAGLDWPAELSGIIPKLERCFINSITPDQAGGYRIICQPEDETVLADYLQVLTNEGFQPTTASHIASLNTIYGKGEWYILANQPSTRTLDLQVWREARLLWPAELKDIVPEPGACRITSLNRIGDQEYHISCSGERENIVADYVDLLITNGFVETYRMEAEAGKPVWLKFQKDAWQVELLISIMNNVFSDLTIKISR